MWKVAEHHNVEHHNKKGISSPHLSDTLNGKLDRADRQKKDPAEFMKTCTGSFL
ncbi:MAG: hypothetical protein Tsb009_33200 [Planctomycetaceae bacterium]